MVKISVITLEIYYRDGTATSRVHVSRTELVTSVIDFVAVVVQAITGTKPTGDERRSIRALESQGYCNYSPANNQRYTIQGKLEFL